MIDELQRSRLLYGARGQPPADVDSIVDVLLSMSHLLVACPEIEEIDINPLVVFEEGSAAVDARAIVRRQKT